MRHNISYDSDNFYRKIKTFWFKLFHSLRKGTVLEFSEILFYDSYENFILISE